MVLRMSRPLFVGSYLQVTWWTLGKLKGRKKNASNDYNYCSLTRYTRSMFQTLVGGIKNPSLT